MPFILWRPSSTSSVDVEVLRHGVILLTTVILWRSSTSNVGVVGVMGVGIGFLCVFQILSFSASSTSGVDDKFSWHGVKSFVCVGMDIVCVNKERPSLNSISRGNGISTCDISDPSIRISSDPPDVFMKARWLLLFVLWRGSGLAWVATLTFDDSFIVTSVPPKVLFLEHIMFCKAVSKRRLARWTSYWPLPLEMNTALLLRSWTFAFISILSIEVVL